jgi:hypothetical protein
MNSFTVNIKVYSRFLGMVAGHITFATYGLIQYNTLNLKLWTAGMLW